MDISANPELALSRANWWGRDRFKDSIVSFAQLDDAAMRAQDRLLRSRSAEVRAACGRLMRHNKTYRWFRYLVTAPAAELRVLASHSLFGGSNV